MRQAEAHARALIHAWEHTILGRHLAYEIKPDLRCPHRGQIRWTDLPYDQARILVGQASIDRSCRRVLAEPSPISEAEVVLLCALLFYGEAPVLQHPVGPYDLDFYIADYDAAIEVDGREWHDPEKDARRDRRVLELAGIHTYRIPAADVFKDPLWACRRVCRSIADDRREARLEVSCPTS